MTELKRTTQLAWRRMLLTPEGQEAMLYLRECTPRVISRDADGIIFEAGINQGYTSALDRLSEIVAVPSPKPESLENP